MMQLTQQIGRVTAVRRHNELTTDMPYAIAFEYQPKATLNDSDITAHTMRRLTMMLNIVNN